MGEKDKIFTEKVKYAGLFDFKELYRFCYIWLTDNNYFVTEKVYSEKIQPNGKEVDIEWASFKGVSDYFKFIITVKWRVLGLTSVEVEKDGKKTKMDKAYLELAINGVIEKDYENKWSENAFYSFLRGIYEKYIVKGRVEGYEDKLAEECEEMIAQIKAFLALEGKKQ
ncbi:hypothetical protein COV16_00665 [Candidatus Woesearchaeota archaeon CG10_big_fil_rev_8_21_14_0_10_34_8]|nr:MAG: hypothetical protein COV16_00665 [Candidatus Woesearchaeota archaeon CG10_big_fil_rev_8_21_14_0_10_34_8]